MTLRPKPQPHRHREDVLFTWLVVLITAAVVMVLIIHVARHDVMGALQPADPQPHDASAILDESSTP
jgi:hypothetical protein